MAPDAESSRNPAPRPARPGLSRSEWGVILVLAAVQFTHMVDFVIIMPLGKRLMSELSMSAAQFGNVIAAYAVAATVSSLLGSTVTDRFDRKAVLLVMYAGFAATTLLCGLAPSYEWLLAARALAGAFGGLAASMVMAFIGDVFAAEKRGRAGGAVMSAFAVASIAGLPIGLTLAGWLGRWAPFVALAWLSAAVWVVAWWRLPSIRGHITAVRRDPWDEFLAVAREPAHVRAFAFTFSLVLGTFTVASFIGPYLMGMNGWGEDDVAVIYLVAGLCTFVSMNTIGRWADRVSRRWLFVALGSAALVMALVITNLPRVSVGVASVVVSAFMVCASGRMIPAQAMLLGVAAPRVRGAFVSLNTAVQHLGTAVAPIVAGQIVREQPDGTLSGYPLVGLVAAGAAAASLVLSGTLRASREDKPMAVIVEQAPEPVAV